MHIEEILAAAQTIIAFVSILLIGVALCKGAKIKKSAKLFAMMRNLVFAVILLGAAYAIKHAGHIFGFSLPFATSDEVYLGLEILAAAFFTFAMLDIIS